MVHLKRSLGLALAGMLALAAPASAQQPSIVYQPDPDSPIGTRNPKAPAETAQFDFVIGDWDVWITWTPENGEPQSYAAKWHNHWIIDGFAVMQEWRGPYITGAEFRFYDPQKKGWYGHNIYVGNEWKSTTAEYKDGKMMVYIDKAGPKGDFINRETYFDITADTFKMKSDRSYDGGETWETGAYSMTATRVR